MRMFRSLALLISIVLLGATVLLGCGGSAERSGVTSRGRVTLTVAWPSTRAIPAETRSIKVVAKVLQPEDGPEVGEAVAQRPEGQATSQIVLEDIPSVKVRLSATAHASTDGSGEVLASGSTEVNVPENSSVATNITLQAGPDGCPAPKARASVRAFVDGPLVEELGIQSATAGPSNSQKVVKDAEFIEHTVQTSATATVNGRSSTYSMLRGAQVLGHFQEWLMISAPGKQGELANATVTMSASTPSGAAGVDKTLGYDFWVQYTGRGLSDSTFRITGSRGNVETGDPPPQGSVSGTIEFRYGEPFLLDIGAALNWNDNTFPTSSAITASWQFVSMQLPAGASLVPATDCPAD